MRCDRVDFPPGGVAYRHVASRARDPAAAPRRADDRRATGPTRSNGPGDAWFEGADYPVLAAASPSEDTAFVRVLLLPREWAGKRTIRYVDPADEEKPKLQRATVLLEEPLEL